MRAVSQYTIDGQYIKTYKTMKEAATAVNALPTQVYQCIHRKNKYKPTTCNGYCFKYANEQEDKMNTIEFSLKNGQKVSFTEKEAEQATKMYRTMLTILDELEKNPRMIPTMKQAMYEAIREIGNAKSETKETTEENANKTEWKPFMEKN